MVEKLRTFEHFPADAVCPVCGSQDDSECVLVAVDDTGDGKISEALPVHLACAVAHRYCPSIKIIYRRCL